MPRISRFLFANWLVPHYINCNTNHPISSAYTDNKENYHCRSITRIDKGWQIKDVVTGYFKRATLRFLLCPGQRSLTSKTKDLLYKRFTIIPGIPAVNGVEVANKIS